MKRIFTISLILCLFVLAEAQESNKSWLPVVEEATEVKVFFPDQISYQKGEFYAVGGAKETSKYICKTDSETELIFSFFKTGVVKTKDIEMLINQWQEQTGLQYGAKIIDKSRLKKEDTKIFRVKYQTLNGQFLNADFFYFKGYAFKVSAFANQENEVFNYFLESYTIPATIEKETEQIAVKSLKEWLEIKEGKFNIKFPEKPLDKNFFVKKSKASYNLNSKALENEGGINYIITYRDYENEPNPLIIRDKVLEQIDDLHNSALLYHLPLTIYNYPCEEYVFRDQFYNYKLRTYLVNNRLYQLMIKSNKRKATAWEHEYFFDEFVIYE